MDSSGRDCAVQRPRSQELLDGRLPEAEKWEDFEIKRGRVY